MRGKLFLDTANLGELLTWRSRGVIAGVTTNQLVLLKEGWIDLERHIVALCDAAPELPIAVELTTHGTRAMIEEGLRLSSWRKNVVVKVPMTVDGSGLEVIHALTSRRVATNATIMMTAEQVILGALAGAAYVSLFFNRARDAGEDPVRELEKARRFLDAADADARLIAGSIRAPRDVGEAYAAGADIVTVPASVLSRILDHPKTADTIREFDEAWAKSRQAEPAPT